MIMGKKPRRTGKPKAEEQTDTPQEQSFEEFAKDFFPQDSDVLAAPQEGMPSLKWLKEQYQTKSAAIRYLVSEQGGQHPVRKIAKHLGLRYQHVRNVAKTPLKRGPNEDWRPKPTAPNRDDSTDETT